MATIDLAVEQISRDGINLTDTGSLNIADTFQFLNDGMTFLHFKKTGAGGCNVTIVTQPVVDGQAAADRVVNVPATTGDVMIGPFPRDIYNDAAGKVVFTISEATGLTVAVARLP